VTAAATAAAAAATGAAATASTGAAATDAAAAAATTTATVTAAATAGATLTGRSDERCDRDNLRGRCGPDSLYLHLYAMGLPGADFVIKDIEIIE